MKLYEIGSKRIDSDLSIERIIKNIRDMKVLVKNKLMDEKLKFEI